MRTKREPPNPFISTLLLLKEWCVKFPILASLETSTSMTLIGKKAMGEVSSLDIFTMVSWVFEFLVRVPKISEILHKNQHTRRKF